MGDGNDQANEEDTAVAIKNLRFQMIIDIIGGGAQLPLISLLLGP